MDASDCPRIIDATAVFLQLLWPNPERYSQHAVSVSVWTVWCVQIDSFLVVIPRNSLPQAAFTVTTPTQLSSIVAEPCRAGVVSLSYGGLKIKRLICCGSQSPGEIKRTEVVLDPQVSPEEIMSREVELGCESWTSFTSVVSQQQCYGHGLCSAQQLKEQLPGTLVATQWRGNTALTFLLFWRRSTASSVIGVGAGGQAFTLSPTHPQSPSLISHLASVDVNQNV